MLEQHYEHQRWVEFADEFKRLYLKGDNMERLALYRSLLSKYRDVNAMKAVIFLDLPK